MHRFVDYKGNKVFKFILKNVLNVFYVNYVAGMYVICDSRVSSFLQLETALLICMFHYYFAISPSFDIRSLIFHIQ